MSEGAITALHRHNVRIAGNPQATRTLVFSHGFGTDQTEWTDIVTRFAADHRCVLFDHAGAGNSQPGSYDAKRHQRLAGHAHDLVEIAEALDLRESTIIGHSAGGMIGLIAAVDRPERFAKLVMIGATARYQDEDGYHGGFTRENLIELYRMMMTDFNGWLTHFSGFATGKPDGDALRVYLRHMLARLGPDQALAMARTVLETDIREWLPLVEQPTLILQTVDDPIVPKEAAEYLQRSIARSRLEVLAATGHFGFRDVPDTVAVAIRGFLAT